MIIKNLKGYIVIITGNFDLKEKLKNDPYSYIGVPGRFKLDFDKKTSRYREFPVFINKEDAEEYEDFRESNYGEDCEVKELDIKVV